jgi:predicted nuclease with TOPRIM domain
MPPLNGFSIKTPEAKFLSDIRPRGIVRELNRLNVEMDEKRKDIVYLATEKAKLEERIKRLEEDSQRLNWLLNRGLAWRECYNDWWKEGEWLYASQSALETIDKAKEAK